MGCGSSKREEEKHPASKPSGLRSQRHDDRSTFRHLDESSAHVHAIDTSRVGGASPADGSELDTEFFAPPLQHFSRMIPEAVPFEAVDAAADGHLLVVCGGAAPVPHPSVLLHLTDMKVIDGKLPVADLVALRRAVLCLTTGLELRVIRLGDAVDDMNGAAQPLLVRLKAPATALAVVSRDLVAVGVASGEIRLYDAVSSDEVDCIALHRTPVRCITPIPGGPVDDFYAASSAFERGVKVWELHNGTLVNELPSPDEGCVVLASERLTAGVVACVSSLTVSMHTYNAKVTHGQIFSNSGAIAMAALLVTTIPSFEMIILLVFDDRRDRIAVYDADSMEQRQAVELLSDCRVLLAVGERAVFLCAGGSANILEFDVGSGVSPSVVGSQ